MNSKFCEWVVHLTPQACRIHEVAFSRCDMVPSSWIVAFPIGRAQRLVSTLGLPCFFDHISDTSYPCLILLYIKLSHQEGSLLNNTVPYILELMRSPSYLNAEWCDMSIILCVATPPIVLWHIQLLLDPFQYCFVYWFFFPVCLWIDNQNKICLHSQVMIEINHVCVGELSSIARKNNSWKPKPAHSYLPIKQKLFLL